ncbi:hypothetical protein H1C71_025042 [Ictidomys tridecemlineatus]|nr:hypothetical protein H1C71_025042 [Ictidomys tridecemlineatus]
MLSLDKIDGSMSSDILSSRNDTKVDLCDSNMPDSFLPAENQEIGSGFAFSPFHPIKVPLFSMDPRSQFMRKGPFFPSTSSKKYVWSISRIFSITPSIPMVFSSLSPPKELDFFPHLPPLHSENRSEFPSELIPLSSEPATEHPEAQQET